jgi:hypothetical protein
VFWILYLPLFCSIGLLYVYCQFTVLIYTILRKKDLPIYCHYTFLFVDHIMDLGEGNNTPRVKRAKATNWPRVMSKFLLDWYLEKKKGMPSKAKFKKEHHVWCTSAVNTKFKTTFSIDQVHRHFRRFKEIWIIVARYVNENGSRFDKKHKMLVLPPSTMARLPVSTTPLENSTHWRTTGMQSRVWCKRAINHSQPLNIHLTVAEFISPPLLFRN